MNYKIRKASLSDVSFIADVIIGAEKSMTENLGLAKLFGLSESELKTLIISMLKEEICGCEFSLDSFFVACYNEKPVAALGGWMEGHYDGMRSAMLKSNLISFTFPTKILQNAASKIDLIKELQIERERGAYQLEYSFVDFEHRGNRLTQSLMAEHLNFAKSLDPNVKKAQLQIFENNEIITRVHQQSGYCITKRLVSENGEILNYFPHNVKLLMEKFFIEE